MNIKKILSTLVLTLGALIIVTTATFATATLIPSSTIGEQTHYTLNDIYTRLTTNEISTLRSGLFTVPTGSPDSSFYTLEDIYEAIPTIDPSKVASGTTYLGIEGELFVAVPEMSGQIAENVNWQDAVEYCEGLQEDGGGWRLPTYLELINVHLRGSSNFAIEGAYWSNTEFLLDTNSAYVIHDDYSSIRSKNITALGQHALRAWCIR